MATRGLLDTSVVIAVETGRPVDYGAMPLQQFICSISLAELHLGVHTASNAESRSARMGTLEAIAGIRSLSVNAAAAAHWGRLRYRLREAGRRMNVNDLWIASVALAHDMPVITQDQDFTILSDLDGPAVVMV
ncbi:type II toxin-antitoxin system VapC family toxin [Leifsonia bigeumensis]|uniref:Ribonuclease VapC n=1 Tax=Leifsonella bigeumensis TaxID=433643 RepID=A0ABP7FB64_9MICO